MTQGPFLPWTPSTYDGSYQGISRQFLRSQLFSVRLRSQSVGTNIPTDPLAKFVSAPIQCTGVLTEVWRGIASANRAVGELMSAICDVDLATFCGRIGNLYGRHGLCPPFALHAAAQGWMAREIPLSHCMDVIEHFLSRHAGSCYFGSGDWNFAWLNSLIQTSWYERSFARPPWPAPQQSRHDNWGDSYGSEEPSQRPARREVFTAGPPNSVSKPASCEPGRVALRQRAARARDTRSASSQQTHRPQRSASKPSRQTLAPSPKKIEVAVAWLRVELAGGERPAAEVEAKALCAGIAPRTYDRARQCLGVTSRRVGFGRWAKYLIALPVPHETPSEGATMAGAT